MKGGGIRQPETRSFHLLVEASSTNHESNKAAMRPPCSFRILKLSDQNVTERFP